MNRSITGTNVVLNLAISPSLWLIPSNLIILKNPINGYNNKLRVTTTNMKFGINENLNYFEHQKLSFLDTLKDKPRHSLQTPRPTREHNSEADSDLVIILVLSSLSGYIISKYVL